jgi:hypothetical protein
MTRSLINIVLTGISEHRRQGVTAGSWEERANVRAPEFPLLAKYLYERIKGGEMCVTFRIR